MLSQRQIVEILSQINPNKIVIDKALEIVYGRDERLKKLAVDYDSSYISCQENKIFLKFRRASLTGCTKAVDLDTVILNLLPTKKIEDLSPTDYYKDLRHAEG